MSIYKKIQNAKLNPDTVRSGCLWSKEEDYKLEQSVFNDKSLSEIALDHKRTPGSIELRLRSLAYNYFVNNTDSVETVAQKFRISVEDFQIFVKDRKKYLEMKEEKEYEKELIAKAEREVKERKKREEKAEKEAKLAAEKADREAKLAAEKAERDARIAAEKTEREARIAAEKAERDAMKEREAAARAERDAKLVAEKAEREAKLAMEKADREAKLAAEKAEKEAKKLVEKAEKEKMKEEEKEYNYLYILREREFIKTGEKIYKIGKTTVSPFKRMSQYPNNSDIILILKTDNCHTCEREVLKHFDKTFKRATAIGREYYYADTEDSIIKEMISVVFG